MADLNLSLSDPLTALLKSTLDFSAKIADYAMVERQTMDVALLKRKDEITVKGLERADKLMDKIWHALKLDE